MAEQELLDKIKQSMEEGYRPREISEVLSEEGHSQQEIREAFEEVRREMEYERSGDKSREERQEQPEGPNPEVNSGRSGESQTGSGSMQQETTAQKSSDRDVIAGIELTDTEYTIRQKFIMNKYRIYDSGGELVLRAKQKLFKLKEDFPFKNEDGDIVFRVKSENIIDTAGDYVLEDEQTGEPVVSLDRKWTLFMHRWKVRDPEDEALLAKVEGDRKILQALRVLGGVIPYFPNVFAILPHRYRIVDHKEEELGEMQGKLSLRDIYTLKLEDSGRAPQEGLVAAAIAIDALEGN